MMWSTLKYSKVRIKKNCTFGQKLAPKSNRTSCQSVKPVTRYRCPSLRPNMRSFV